MTICNMSIEGGARAGMIAPDDATIEYVAGREFSPKGADWDSAVARWRALPSDEGATYDSSIMLDAAALEPMITYGTNPGMGMRITERIPDPAGLGDANQKLALEKALNYMDLRPGQPLLGKKVSRCWARRSTWSSSARAPTRASRICASRPGCSKAARSPTDCG